MEKINAVITGVGGYVPQYILDNDEMSKIVDTSDEWIMERIGVKTRHILKDEERNGAGVSYMMTKAVQELLQKTQIDPDSVEAVICATSTPDYVLPSTAASSKPDDSDSVYSQIRREKISSIPLLTLCENIGLFCV